MIGRGFKREQPAKDGESKGFDAFELRLGDLMRGERATMGKSLLDVQRELKIKAAYIAAIENADPTAFDTPGFIAGYVRSYARYLNMDPDWAFDTFCRESGFATAHGMSEQASSVKPSREDRLAARPAGKDIFAQPATPFVPGKDAMLSRIEPGAIGSVLVLVALIGGLGYGGWTVLQEVQRVQLAPVEERPTVVSEIDPLAGNAGLVAGQQEETATLYTPPAPEGPDRLVRPQALEVPVMVARDAPISTLDPSTVGTFGTLPEGASAADPVIAALDEALAEEGGSAVQVTEDPAPAVQLVAVRPAWVRVRSGDGTVLFEAIMNAGDTYTVPQTEEPATLRIGESGAVYFAVNGDHYGPVGPRGTVSSNVALSVENLTSAYEVADLEADQDLARMVNVAEVQPDQ